MNNDKLYPKILHLENLRSTVNKLDRLLNHLVVKSA